MSFLDAFSQDYFQQEVNYIIKVSLNDKIHELNGFETIEYINNSPDTLRFLYFHLWPNAYSCNNTRLARQLLSFKGKGRLFNDPELRGYIDSLDFKTDNNPVLWDLLPGFPDICKIILNNPLIGGDTIYISTPFHVKIPDGSISLLGHTADSYNISQWYPKPAVYDKSGWHPLPYLDQGEFFSEFGSFDVSITLPDNYIVAATGNLWNEEEKRRLDILSEDKSWIEIPASKESGSPASSGETKTLRYTEKLIHDFAWFADKRFIVQKGNVRLPYSGREVTTWVMFRPQEALLWKDAVSYVTSSILDFSEWIGDYPYDTFTAVRSDLSAGAGMEYPGLTVISHTDDPYLLNEVLAHEICHSWFYSSLGSDERRFPFMDESIVGAYESRYMNERYPDKKLWELSFKNKKVARLFRIEDIPVQRMQETEWLTRARSNLEQPLNLPAPDYNQADYYTMIYNKGAQGFTWLRSYLGNSVFDSIMQVYFDIWKHRHPRPEDLRAIFESGTSKEISWFFDDFLGTTKRLDYKLVRFQNHQILIENKGELIAPFLLAEITGDSVISEKWEEGFEGRKWINASASDISEIKIDPDHKTTELFRLNNNIRTSGIFRRSDPFQARFLFTLEDHDKRSLIYIPAADWNSTDGFMAGMAFHNGMQMRKPVQYFAIPLYVFNNHSVAGYGKVSFNIIPYDKTIRIATISFEGSQYGAPGNQNFKKAKAGLDLYLRSSTLINPVNQKLFGYFITATDLPQIELLTHAKMRSYIQAGYVWERSGAINPYNMSFAIESGKSFQKASLELNYKYSYYGVRNGLEIRIFAGTMLNNTNPDPIYAFSPGGRSGLEQYLYPGIYPDRFGEFPETFWSRQMAVAEGGLVSKLNDSLGYSRSLGSITLTSSLPGIASSIPVKPFLTLLLNDHGYGTTNNSLFFAEAGFKAGLWNFFEIYFPLLVTDNIAAITGSLKNRIRFVFKLDIFNPLRI